MNDTTYANPRLIALAGAHNIRDMGGWPLPGGQTEWRRVFRADSLHRLDEEGLTALRDLGLRLVIDLRRAEELAHAPNPFAAETSAGGLPGVTYAHVSLFEDLDPARYGFGQATEGQEDILLALYRLALEERGPVFVEVLRLIAEAPDGAVLFHCTAGKDRTGLIAALLLLIAGADHGVIAEDYAETAIPMQRLAPVLRAETEARGIDFDAYTPLHGASPETMRALLSELETRHGGAETWLRRHGLTEAEIDRLRARLAPRSALHVTKDPS